MLPSSEIHEKEPSGFKKSGKTHTTPHTLKRYKKERNMEKVVKKFEVSNGDRPYPEQRCGRRL